jgi:hypothetical protein
MSESYPPSNPFEPPVLTPEAERKPDFLVPVEKIIPGIKPRMEIRQEIENIDLGAPFPNGLVGFLGRSIQPWLLNKKLIQDTIIEYREAYKKMKARELAKPENERKYLQEIEFDLANVEEEVMYELGEEKPLMTMFRNFQDQIVVDLGAGKSRYGHSLCSLFGAKAYVGVEKHFAKELEEYISYSTPEKIEKTFDRGPAGIEPIPAAIEDADMLSFLRRLPDNSVSIFASGIDRNIICDNEYLDAVRKEIGRVLHPKGAYISHESHAMEFEFEDISREQPNRKEDIYFFRKNKE